MYSILPLTNSAGSHSGFFMYVVLTGILLVLILWAIKEEGLSLGKSFWVIMIISSYFLAYHNSYDEENNIPMVNKKVVAKFVGYNSEQQSHNCGKNQKCFTSKVYGQFNTPEGMVLLEVDRSAPIAENVILYKN